jgi:hypothetical protein
MPPRPPNSRCVQVLPRRRERPGRRSGRLRAAVRNWTFSETFSIGSGESFRILEILTELDAEMVDARVNAVFVVELA